MRVGRINKKYVSEFARRRGFTLVEVLVVLTIIAVLSAILFPVYAKLNASAQISQCLSNMKGIGAALQMYVDEHAGKFPAAAPFGSQDYWRSQGQATIQGVLAKYAKSGVIRDQNSPVEKYISAGIFACPCDNGTKEGIETGWGVLYKKTVWEYTGCSYEYYSSNQEDWLSREENPPTVPWTGLAPEYKIAGKLKRIGAPVSAVVAVSKKAVLGEV